MKVFQRIRLPLKVQVCGDTYLSHEIYEKNSRYIWQVKILATTKPTILSQNLCCRYSKQHKVMDASIRLCDEFQSEKYSMAFLWNPWNILTRIRRRKKKITVRTLQVGTIKSLLVPNCSMSWTSLMDLVVILQRLLTNEYYDVVRLLCRSVYKLR